MANKMKELTPVHELKSTEGLAPIGEIGENGNQRRRFDDKAMQELIESVRRQGIINPLTVRHASVEEAKDGRRFVLIAGARRLHAAQQANLQEVPIRVIFDVTEDQCQEIQAVENLQRADLTPIEEANSYKVLFSRDGAVVMNDNALDVALKVGKTPAHVKRTLQLLELDPKVQSMIDAGEMPLSIAQQLLRVPEKNREALVKYATTKMDWHKRLPNLEEVKTQIERTVEKDLKHAFFPKDVDNYGSDEMPACNTCPFNTGNQTSLFAGAEDGKCTNPGCFSKRTSTFFMQLKDKGAERWPDLKYAGVGSRGYNDEAQIGPNPVVDASSAKIKKLMAEKPEAFGYGILRDRSGWGRAPAKPKLVLVAIDASVLPAKDRPVTEDRRVKTPRERAKDEFVENWTTTALATLAMKKLGKRWKELLADLAGETELRGPIGEVFGIDEDMEESQIKKIVAKLDPANLVMLIWFDKVSEWQFESELKNKGIATKPVVAAAEKDARTSFERRNALRCRVCGCSQDVACKIKKPGGESWQTIPCSWYDAKSKTPTCNAHAKPKEAKADAKK